MLNTKTKLPLQLKHFGGGELRSVIKMRNESLEVLWKRYNEYNCKIASALGRTNNVVGEFSEHLVHKYYGGEIQKASNASYDIKSNSGARYQVKSRKVDRLKSTSLNVIRSWDFDHLVVIIFDQVGTVLKALEVPVVVAKEYAVVNKHQNGHVITTSKAFLEDERNKDLTQNFGRLL